MTSIQPPAPLALPDRDTSLPGDFYGPALEQHPERYRIELDAAEQRELSRIAAAIEREGAGLAAEPRVHETLWRVTDASRRLLSLGPGVALLRGVPVDGFKRDTLARLFTWIGTALGVPAPQNFDGELITDIRDTGADPTDPEVRLYRTRAEQDFHTDGADLIGLLSLHPAASGGVSQVVSSVRVFRQIAERRPELAPMLLEPWHFHLPGAAALGLPPTIQRPIVSYDGRKLETFFIGWYLRRAQGLDGVPPLDEARGELLGLFEETASDPEFTLNMALQPGDLQWLRNAFVLHKRTAYEDPPPPMPRRHLLRLWLNAPFLNDSTPRFDASEVRR